MHDLSLLTVLPVPGPVGDPQVPSNFALHDHAYLSHRFPDPSHAYVRSEFDEAVVVDSIVVVQHSNGITFLQHSYGDAVVSLLAGTLAMSGTFGDATGIAVMPEYTNDSFLLSDGGSGLIHELAIAKTSHHEGWASYRFYLDFHAVAIPEPGTAALILLGLIVPLGIGVRRHRRAD